MDKSGYSRDTMLYYERNAGAYAYHTVDCDVRPLRDRFLALLKPGAKILDLGCGSGRDALYFTQRGFDVTPLDASEKLCQIAEKVSGLNILRQDFREMDFQNAFDGIWACASLLHVASAELPGIMRKCMDAMKVGAHMYCSFKYGRFEGIRNARYYTDLDEEGLKNLLKPFDNVKIVELSVSDDVRATQPDEKWLNAFLRKDGDRIG